MPTLIDTDDLYRRAPEGLDTLAPPERLVYLLQDFEVLMEMEGWDHFFYYERYFVRYPELKEWLSAIGEDESLVILRGFEEYVAAQGIPLTPDSIGELLARRADSADADEPDWRELYMARTSERWNRVSAWLSERGYAIAGM